jgi:hypothetical protein
MADLWNPAIVLFAGVLIVWAVWWVTQPRYALVIAIADSRVRLIRGKATPVLLHAAQEICARHGLAEGEIRGTWRGKQIVLSFSPSIPADAQQQLRNVWLASR